MIIWKLQNPSISDKLTVIVLKYDSKDFTAIQLVGIKWHLCLREDTTKQSKLNRYVCYLKSQHYINYFHKTQGKPINYSIVKLSLRWVWILYIIIIWYFSRFFYLLTWVTNKCCNYLDSLEQPLHESLLSCLSAQARSELCHIFYNSWEKKKSKNQWSRKHNKMETTHLATFVLKSSMWFTNWSHYK